MMHWNIARSAVFAAALVIGATHVALAQDTTLQLTVENGQFSPAELQAPLNRLRDDLLSAAGDALIAMAVYGSAARGRWRAGKSDVNLLVLLRRCLGELDVTNNPESRVVRFIGRQIKTVEMDQVIGGLGSAQRGA